MVMADAFGIAAGRRRLAGMVANEHPEQLPDVVTDQAENCCRTCLTVLPSAVEPKWAIMVPMACILFL